MRPDYHSRILFLSWKDSVSNGVAQRVTKQFLTELQEKHRVTDAVFLIDGAPWLQAALFEEQLRFQHITHGNQNSVERVFKGLKRRTNPFANHFRHAAHRSAENWLQTIAFAWNQLI